MYKLFVGFKKLGEFDSILKAKQFAHESGLTGAFNLLGTNGYRDSWYVFEKHNNKTNDGNMGTMMKTESEKNSNQG